MALKGIPMQPGTKERIAESVDDMLFGKVVEGCNKETFRRNPRNWTVQTVPLVRNVSCLYTARAVGKGFRTYPMGFKNIPFPEEGSLESRCVKQMLTKLSDANLLDEYFDDIIGDGYGVTEREKLWTAQE